MLELAWLSGWWAGMKGRSEGMKGRLKKVVARRMIQES
jgi:hypothetical protein